MTTKQMHRLIQELRRSRKGWLDILEESPDSVQCAQHILSINTQIQMLNTLRYTEGDFSEVKDD